LEQDSEPKGGEAQETPNDTRKKRRLTPSIDCPKAARRLEKHLSDKGIGLNKFAVAVGTNEKTLYRFRKSGKVHRDIFEAIAREMGITKEDLLNS
jgi:DNA-binding Xre family transcriptional regulator